jgi:hypothetical protein
MRQTCVNGVYVLKGKVVRALGPILEPQVAVLSASADHSLSGRQRKAAGPVLALVLAVARAPVANRDPTRVSDLIEIILFVVCDVNNPRSMPSECR